MLKWSNSSDSDDNAGLKSAFNKVIDNRFSVSQAKQDEVNASLQKLRGLRNEPLANTSPKFEEAKSPHLNFSHFISAATTPTAPITPTLSSPHPTSQSGKK